MRARVEKARLQIPQCRAHFIEHGRSVLPHLAGEPQQLHFALERLLDQPASVGWRGLAGEQTVSYSRL